MDKQLPASGDEVESEDSGNEERPVVSSTAFPKDILLGGCDHCSADLSDDRRLVHVICEKCYRRFDSDEHTRAVAHLSDEEKALYPRHPNDPSRTEECTWNTWEKSVVASRNLGQEDASPVPAESERQPTGVLPCPFCGATTVEKSLVPETEVPESSSPDVDKNG